MMNFLKSVFISGFVSWLMFVSLYSLVQLLRGAEPLISWIGLALTAMPPLGFFIRAFLFRQPRTRRHPVEFSILSSLGLAVTMAMSFRHGQVAGNIHVWAGITLLGWMLYLRWYSTLRGRDAKAINTGQTLPAFNLVSMDGHAISSESFRARPHLLLFYRGNWCPFCTAQIEELAAAYRQLEEMGVRVVLISPQSATKSQKLSNRFDIPLVFLRDPGLTAAKQLGILHTWGTPMGMQILGYESDTVLPTVILSDAKGDIVFTNQTDNYRVRPEPGVFKAIVEGLPMDITKQ